MNNIEEFNSYIGEKKWIAKAVEGTKGKLRKELGIKKGETLTKARIEDEIKDLESQDTDTEKKGTQLPTDKAKKFKRLHLAKTLMKLGEDHNEHQNYMFFANVSNIKKICEEILEMDQNKVDHILSRHGWATDHIATSKDDVSEVYDFLRSTMDLYNEEDRGLISEN